MSVVNWLREWWLLPLVLAMWAAFKALLNAAVIRDFAIVETKTAAHARWTMVGGNLLWVVAFLSPVVPVEWGDDEVRVVLVGFFVVGFVVHGLGETVIVARRIMDRWHRAPWYGDEKRRYERRTMVGGGPEDRVMPIDEERRGERRGRPPLQWPQLDPGAMPAPAVERWFPDRDPSAEARR